MNILDVKNIAYRVSNRKILNDVSFSICEGDKFALLGENGSGKSTLFSIILNDIYPNSGEILYNGDKKIDYKNIGISYDNFPLFPMLKVKEVIHYFSVIYKININEIIDEYFDIFSLRNIESSLISQLSLGEQKKVGLLISIMRKPKFLMLDEPFANLDPTVVDRIWSKLKFNTPSILYTTHNWNDTLRMASKVCFLKKGKIIMDIKSPHEVLNDFEYKRKIVLEKSSKVNDILSKLKYIASENDYTIFSNDINPITNLLTELSINFSVSKVDFQDISLLHSQHILK